MKKIINKIKSLFWKTNARVEQTKTDYYEAMQSTHPSVVKARKAIALIAIGIIIIVFSLLLSKFKS